MRQDALVGRRAELESLSGWLDDALAGHPRLVLCGGEPGIGKTRLAAELTRLAQTRGVTTRWARTHEDVGLPPYWMWRQALAEGDAAAAVDPPASLDDRDEGGGRFQLFDRVSRRLVADAHERGLVLVLEDVHWADQPSLLLLRHLIRELRGARMLVTATYRTVGTGTGEGDGWPAIMPDLVREPVAVRLDLGGLELADTRARIASVRGEPVSEELAREVQRLSAGNPFFVGELAGTLDRREGDLSLALPGSVMAVVRQRVGRLSTEGQAFLAAAAVLGESFSLAVAASLVARGVMACLPLTEEATAAGLIAPGDAAGDWYFAHAIVRDAVESQIGSVERVRLHRAAAEAIERIYAGNLGLRLADLARHWAVVASAGDAAPALLWARRAADAAMTALAYEEGARLYQLALDVARPDVDEDTRCRLLLGLAAARWKSSELPASWAACREVIERAARIGRPDLAAEAALTVEPVGSLALDVELRDWCGRALASLGEEGDPSVRARLLARLTEAAVYAGDAESAVGTSEGAMAVAAASDDPDAVVAALRARQLALSGPEHSDERRVIAERMIESGLVLRRPAVEMWGRLWRIDAHWDRGELAEIRTELPRLRWCTEQVGGRMAEWHLLVTRAALAQATARFDDAVDLARRGFELARSVGHPTAFGAFMSLVSGVGHHTGHGRAGGLPLWDDEAAPPPDGGEVREAIWAHLGLAFLLAELGRVAEAGAAYRRAGPPQRWRPPPYFRLLSWAFGCATAIALDERDDVEFFHRELEPERGRHVVAGAGTASYAGPVELYLGRADAFLGRLERAEEELSAAVAVCRATGAPGFEVEAECELAAVLLRRGGPGDAERGRAAAAHAQGAADRLGMVPWAARAAALAGATAGPGEGVDSNLSPREREVAQLVAQGRTNREIAETLYISERTAQTHVQHILAKLSFSNRSQLAAWVAALHAAPASSGNT